MPRSNPRTAGTAAAGDDIARPAVKHEGDLALVRRVLEGEAEAWQEFSLRYERLIRAVVRRYMGKQDMDEVHSVVTDVLTSMRVSKLATYEGRAALSTWTTLVARAQVVDHLRHRFGRLRGARVLRRLPSAHQRLFRMYHVEGRSAAEVVAELNSNTDAWSIDRFIDALQEVESQLGERWLRHLAYDLHAQSVGAASGRLLEYLDHVRQEYQRSAGAYSADYLLLERESRQLDDRLRLELSRLRPADRQLMEMRFERGWSANEIAAELGVDDTRSVYTMIYRVLRQLRRALTRA